jgi:hypothetical protein
VSISGLNGSSDRIQNLPDAETVSHRALSSGAASGDATTKIDDDNLNQNNSSTKPESPLHTALTEMNNMCRGLGQKYAT